MADPTDGSSPPRIYSPRLLGVAGPECNFPRCRVAGLTAGTGWLERGALGWGVEFRCSEHGPMLVHGGEWASLIEEVLREQGSAPRG